MGGGVRPKLEGQGGPKEKSGSAWLLDSGLVKGSAAAAAAPGECLEEMRQIFWGRAADRAEGPPGAGGWAGRQQQQQQEELFLGLRHLGN